MSALVLVLLLLFMTAAAAATTSLDFQLLHEIESGGAVVAGWSNVSSAAAMKHYHHQCLDKEREALLLFKAGLVDYYGLLSSWGSKDLDCCKWWGVHCSSRTGHVIELHLRAPDYRRVLRGKITPSLLELHHLSYLDLSSNNFSGQPFPQFIGSLSKLNYLDLSLCYFSGTIPPQLGNLSNLNHLAVAESFDLATDLDWLPHLTSLQYLDLWGVDLSKANHWVDAIKSLPFLSFVDFSHCQLSSVMYPYSLSSSLDSSTSISTLHLSYNHLTSPMIDWLFNFSTSLVNLTLFGNQLNIPTPKFLRNLCRLQVLELFNNNITGNLEDLLNNLQAGCDVVTLEYLDAGGNHLIGSVVPDGISRFSSLRILYLDSCDLNGTVSENLGTLLKLERLDLSFNSLQGTLFEAHFLNLTNLYLLDLSLNSQLALEVSSHWIPPFQLTYLNLKSCKLGPNSLEWISQTQKNLSYLDIANCGISENIPASFWHPFNALTFLNLSTNQIKGNVPDFPSYFGIYSNPVTDLSSNLFEGPIPVLPSSSTILNLSRNKFSGTLSSLCQIIGKKITFLDISHNLVTGGLPHCLIQFTNLVVLNLAHTKLSLKIPASIGSLFRLETLNLYNNSFFGELPLSMKNCTSLSFLDLGANDFSGNVPSWIGENLRLVYALSLRLNKFSGVIPSHLCYLDKLQFLDLSVNNLSGRIPSCLNNLTVMVEGESSRKVSNHGYSARSYDDPNSYYGYIYLDYAMVEWQGRDMEFQDNLGLLKIIDLSGNQLTGEVPDSITSLRGLIVLDLSRNKLHGNIPAEIGQMKSLLSLNFSENSFSGHLPVGLSTLTSLSSLDVSHNNFSGRIPTGTQLQSFNASNYAGNTGLCGPPLTKRCLRDESPTISVGVDDSEEDNINDEFLKWLYIGMASGFITGFWGVCGFLLLNRSGRHSFFRFFFSFL